MAKAGKCIQECIRESIFHPFETGGGPPLSTGRTQLEDCAQL